jgi:hypothetical protein
METYTSHFKDGSKFMEGLDGLRAQMDEFINGKKAA